MWISPLPQLQQSDSPWDLLPILYALLPSQGTTALRYHGRVRRHYSVGGDRFDCEGEINRYVGGVYLATRGMFRHLRRIQAAGDDSHAGRGLEDDLRLDASLFDFYVLLYHT